MNEFRPFGVSITLPLFQRKRKLFGISYLVLIHESSAEKLLLLGMLFDMDDRTERGKGMAFAGRSSIETGGMSFQDGEGRLAAF